jgi:hypothetical protein
MTTHIQIPAVSPRIQYTANGIKTAFEFPFPIFTNADLEIFIDGVQQFSGYIITGAGQTAGGEVIFATAPINGLVVTLERRLAIARTADFQDGSDFAARTLNNEFDYTVAAIQQLQSDAATVLKFDRDEIPPTTNLPSRALRANKLLGFDGNGAPISYPLSVPSGPVQYTVTGTGAVARSVQDRLNEVVALTDFGAVGDGVVDDTLAIQKALDAHNIVYVPPGIYRTTAPIILAYGKTLHGAGNASIIRANSNSFDAIEIPNGYSKVQNLRIENGNAGILLYGKDGACVENSISDVTIWDANIGLVLDGYNNTNFPCYWNYFSRVLIARPKTHGVHMKRSGAGDSPNANKFHGVRVYSLSANITGSGFYVQSGRYNNSFIDCEANLHTTAQSCIRIGADTEKNIFINPYTETLAAIPNVVLETGSQETILVNLLSASAGPAIQDASGGNYTAYNAGFPDKNRMGKTRLTDLTVEMLRFDTEFFSESGPATLNVDQTTSCYIVSAFAGAVTVNLPQASTANGAQVTIKKSDNTANLITIQETSGSGPDGRTIKLSAQYDYITVVSNGANWWITAHNLMPDNTYYIEGQTLIQPDLTRPIYFVSAFGGTTEFRLPPANAVNAVGRTILIKKIDVSTNAVNVTVSGGSGPDGASQALVSQNKAITVVSNGSAWYVQSKY